MFKINTNTQKYQTAINYYTFEVENSLKENIEKILAKKGSQRSQAKLYLLANILEKINIGGKKLLEAVQSFNDKNPGLKITAETITNLFISILDRYGEDL